MLALYRFLSDAAAPVIRLYLAVRKARGKEDAARFQERLGRAGRARPSGPLVWAHAASIGESLSLLPLVERLVTERPGVGVLVTTGTVTSARLLAERLPSGSFHQYVPVDRIVYVRRFLNHWRPDLALWAESEFWPNLIAETRALGTPMILVNGRVSPRSFSGWQRFGGLIERLLGGFALCLGQTEADADRLRRLGAAGAKYVGNLKFAGPPLPVDGGQLSRLETALGDRPRWLAASTHPGEEEMAARVHRRVAAEHPGLLTIIVPRHPDRGAGIAAALSDANFVVARRSAGDAPEPETEIYLADTLGELGLFYRLVGIAFLGKSLVPLGGQNPLEPARLDCAIIHGPHMMNFADITERLKAQSASEEVSDEEALAAALTRLLAEPGERARMAAAASALAAAEADVLDAVLGALEPFLPPPAPRDATRARA